MNRLLRCGSVVCSFLLWSGIGTITNAQGRMTIQATAMGTSTQNGRMINVNILIDQFSTPDDRKALVDAFARSGQEGLVRVLEDMKPKGRVRFASGGVGNDVKYIMELPLKTGADSVSSRIATLPLGSYKPEHVRGTMTSAPSSCSSRPTAKDPAQCCPRAN